MKTTKKAFIAVSMIGFAAMMFSCAGTNKNVPAAQEATDRTVLEEAPAETPAEENLPEQNTLQSENSSAAQEAVPQNNDVSVPAAE